MVIQECHAKVIRDVATCAHIQEFFVLIALLRFSPVKKQGHAHTQTELRGQTNMKYFPAVIEFD